MRNKWVGLGILGLVVLTAAGYWKTAGFQFSQIQTAMFASDSDEPSYRIHRHTTNDNTWVPYKTLSKLSGSRDLEHRYQVMQLPDDLSGKTVLDLGCNMGRLSIEAARRGATRVVGVDISPETIEVANGYTQWVGQQEGVPIERINYHVFDLNDGPDGLQKIIGDQKFDYVFGLSLWGLVDENSLWSIFNTYTADTCWFEGHDLQGQYGDQSRERIEEILLTNLDAQEVRFMGFTRNRHRCRRANFAVHFKRGDDIAIN